MDSASNSKENDSKFDEKDFPSVYVKEELSDADQLNIKMESFDENDFSFKEGLPVKREPFLQDHLSCSAKCEDLDSSFNFGSRFDWASSAAMKQQQHNLTQFLKNISRFDSRQDLTERIALATTITDHVLYQQSVKDAMLRPSLKREKGPLDVRDKGDAECPERGTLPDCWSMKQAEMFKKKYDGLLVINKKLGCVHCGKIESIKIKGIHVSKEWKSCSVEASGKNKIVQQASLRKKMNDHFSSRAHQICLIRLKERGEDVSTKTIEKASNKNYASPLCRVFNSVYSLAKGTRPLSYIEDEVALQMKNGVEMGTALHSKKAALKILDLVAKQIKTQVFSKIIRLGLKICVLVEDVGSISANGVVVLFVRVEDDEFCPTVFVDLVELEDGDVYRHVMESLHSVGFSEGYLRNNLIGLCSDGASPLTGEDSVLRAEFQRHFPDIVTWHCLSHRLPLILDDSFDEIQRLNRFKAFVDEVATFVHHSNRNQMELLGVAEQFGSEMLKVGRVLDSKWVSSCLTTAVTAWDAYPALREYFSAKDGYPRIAALLTDKSFLEDLAITIDVLEELSLLSSALEGPNLGLSRAEKLILRSIKACRIMRCSGGVYERKMDAGVSFRRVGVEGEENGNDGTPGLPRQQLLDAVVRNLELRLVPRSRDGTQECDRVRDLVNVVTPEEWDVEEVVVPWKAAEEKLHQFAKVFRHQICVNDFRDYVEGVAQRRPNSEGVVQERPNSEGVVQKRPNSEVVVQERPNSEGVVQERLNSEVVVQERPNSEGVVQKRPNTEGVVEERPNSENVVHKRPNSENVVQKRPNSENVVHKRPNSEGVVKKRPNSEGVVQERPNSEGVVQERPNSEGVVQERLNSEVVVQKSPNSKGVVQKRPNTENVVHKRPNSENVVHKRPNSENVVHKRPNSENVVHKSPNSESVVHRSPNAGNVIQKRPNFEIPVTVQKAKSIVNIISPNSSEVKKCLEVLDRIYSDKEGCPEVKNVANLLVINLIGLPLTLWDASHSVQKWLSENHVSSDRKVRVPSDTDGHHGNQVSVWKYLDRDNK